MRFDELYPLEKKGSRKLVQFYIEGVEGDDVGHLTRGNFGLGSVTRILLSERLTKSDPVESPLEQLLGLLLKFRQSEERKTEKIIFGRLEHDGISRFGRHAGGVVTVHFGQIRQHARLPVVRQIRGTREEFRQRHVGPVLAVEAKGNFLLRRRTSVTTQ